MDAKKQTEPLLLSVAALYDPEVQSPHLRRKLRRQRGLRFIHVLVRILAGAVLLCLVLRTFAPVVLSAILPSQRSLSLVSCIRGSTEL
jgi:hypothetical protein